MGQGSEYFDSELFANPLSLPFSPIDESATKLLVDGTQRLYDELAILHYRQKRHASVGAGDVAAMRREVACLALLWQQVLNRAEEQVVELEAMRRSM